MKPAPSILIVDDRLEMCVALRELLTLEGFEVEICTSGEEAIKKFNKQKFDVILVDYHMPGLNGIETLRCLKTLSGNIRFILMTTDFNDALKEAAAKEGVNGFLQKPFDTEELLRRIRQAS
jgi:CheY-like chemotaxis protein